MVLQMSQSVLIVLVVLFVVDFPGTCSFKAPFSLSLRPQQAFHGNGMKINQRSFKLNSQSPEDVKINSQIARLNAVAAKLRAEAADLEVSLTALFNLTQAVTESTVHDTG